VSLSAPARLGACAVLAGLGAAGAVGLLVPAGSAAGTTSAWRPPAGASDPAAVRLLRQAAQAADATAYSGVQYLSAWDSDSGSTSVVVEVSHVPGKGSMVAVRATPGSGGIRVYEDEQGETPGLTGQDLAGGRGPALALLERKYDVDLAAAEDVAGRAADVVEVRRPDGSLAARLWLDVATKMLLRREVTDGHGRMTRASAFVELRMGRTGLLQLAGEQQSHQSPRPWNRRLETADLASLRAAGWAVPDTLPGGLELYDARSGEDDGDEVVHLSFSDGLSTVSLFEQKGRLDTRRLASWRQQKIGGTKVYLRDTLPRRVVWASGGKVYTVLADAPDDTVEAVIDRLPHSSPRTGVLARMGRGLTRVGSWFNPFA
jgi:sigma-E factor negative regulatory protein RseB